jgi:hypothetical protein
MFQHHNITQEMPQNQDRNEAQHTPKHPPTQLIIVMNGPSRHDLVEAARTDSKRNLI